MRSKAEMKEWYGLLTAAGWSTDGFCLLQSLGRFVHQCIESPVVQPNFQEEAAFRFNLRDWCISNNKSQKAFLQSAQCPREPRHSSTGNSEAKESRTGDEESGTTPEVLVTADIIFEKCVPPLISEPVLSPSSAAGYPVKDLACQITLDEAELFRHIEVSEFMDQNWENETTGPAISLLVARYNKISNWVAFSILDLFEEKAQLAIYCKFVKLAQQLHDVQNYNSCTAILGGLSDASVARLKRISSVREPFFPLRPRHDLTIHSESS